MEEAHDPNDGLSLASEAIHDYLMEIHSMGNICLRHANTAAIHDRGDILQVYRLFKREELTARTLRKASNELEGWEHSPFWPSERIHWTKLAAEVARRVDRHSRQHPIVTRGILWNGRPFLIHAYKFEPDPVMKVEIVVPDLPDSIEELPLRAVASSLECHEYLVPSYITTPLAPWVHHEAKFSTISEYLSRTMPTQLYASQCFPLPTLDVVSSA